MADDFEVDVNQTSLGIERINQLARSGLPFNPVSGVELTGQNLVRLRRAMDAFGWTDPRFISQAEAEANGWKVAPGSWNLEIPVLDASNRNAVSSIKLFNASNVLGMPELSDMLAMSDAEVRRMQVNGSDVMDELSIGPARVAEVAADNVESILAGDMQATPGEQPILTADPLEDSRFAVMAPYWQNGLHNAEGIALATEVNAAIKKSGLAENKEAVVELLSAYANARRFGLQIVSERRYKNDQFLKANPAEPRDLLQGAFVRDKEGAYRPASGGLAVLVDKGDSLVLKSRDKNSYSAAMELAVAKGWKAIELKGKPAMLANAWLEAKMMGLDVVNYSPTKEDLAKFNDELAKRNMAKAVAEPSKAMDQRLEQVEVRPFVDAQGQTKMATVVYTVSQEGGADAQFHDPKSAAKAFAKLPATKLPAVVRSVTRADGYVEADVMIAGTGFAQGTTQPVKSVDGMLDHEFNEAFAEVKEESLTQETTQLGALVDSGVHSGKILGIKDGYVIQKVGRDPDKVVRHDLSKLSRVPDVGDVEDIGYDNGRGMLKEPGKGLEQDGGREISR